MWGASISNFSPNFFKNFRQNELHITVTVEEPVEEVIHEDNEWGISLVDEDVPDDLEEQDANEVAKGVRLAYERRVTREADSAPVLENEPENEQSLEELMKQMKNM